MKISKKLPARLDTRATMLGAAITASVDLFFLGWPEFLKNVVLATLMHYILTPRERNRSRG